jgi:hypothetical protein
MKIEQKIWPTGGNSSYETPSNSVRSTHADQGVGMNGNGLGQAADLVLLFSSTALLSQQDMMAQVQRTYPNAHLFGCSTAGEIAGTRVLDDSLVTTAIKFERTPIKCTEVTLESSEKSYQAGKELALTLDHAGLVHVFVLSDGLKVNGSQLVSGLVEHLPPGVAVTGGLSGDGARFEQTLVYSGSSGRAQEGKVAAIGFYGDSLRVGYGSLGGWDPFGPERLITRSKGNVLYELDGHSALGLYKQYLGSHAAELPSSALLFPLSLRSEGEIGVVRTVLSVDEEEQSMTFAGDMPEGAYARLMKANFERLIDGATEAARTSYDVVGASSPELAILISCVGRKLVLKQRIEEEVEGIREVMGDSTTLTGFYSYGEISPFTPSAKCELHNQTMTITTFSER